MNNTFETFKEIIIFIEKITKIEKIFIESKAKNSIQSTSFNKMKKIEQSKGFKESVLAKNDSKKIPFFLNLSFTTPQLIGFYEKNKMTM